MRKRTLARICALKILYQLDISSFKNPQQAINNFFANFPHPPQVKEFAQILVEGVCKNIKEIDRLIQKYAYNWQLHRIAYVDRNILRLACYELIFLDDIPPKVSINEAIELAKKFGDMDSAKFVNGILDSIARECISSSKKDEVR